MCDVSNIIKNAKKSIILLDNFIDDETFKVLEQKLPEVTVEIITDNSLLYSSRNIKRKVCFKSGLKLINTRLSSDFIMIIDDVYLYFLSRSLKFSGKKGFKYVRLTDFSEIERHLYRIKECEKRYEKYGRSLK